MICNCIFLGFQDARPQSCLVANAFDAAEGNRIGFPARPFKLLILLYKIGFLTLRRIAIVKVVLFSQNSLFETTIGKWTMMILMIVSVEEEELD